MESQTPPLNLSKRIIGVTIASILSLPIAVFAPVLLGMWSGYRTQRASQAAGIAAAPTIIQYGGWWWIATHAWKFGTTTVTPTPLIFIATVNGLLLIGSALLSSPGRPAKAIGGVLAAIAAVAFFLNINALTRLYALAAPNKPDTEAQAPDCAKNLKKLYDAAMLYSDSYDSTLPPANRWVTALTDPGQTLVEPAAFKCPTVSGKDSQGVDFVMNGTLSGKRLGDVKDRATTPLFIESMGAGKDRAENSPKPGGKHLAVFLDGRVGPY